MVHNGIEYGVMAAYAEGLNILGHANVGLHQQDVDAETAPLRDAELYQYELDLPAITEVWRRGQRHRQLAARSDRPGLRAIAAAERLRRPGQRFGEGRWTSIAAIDSGAPAPVLTSALYERFSSRGEADFADKVLSAMRFGFGGHLEKEG